jgi:hypothetical protein
VLDSDASWLYFFPHSAHLASGASVDAYIYYYVDPNSTGTTRTGHITATFRDGARLVLTVTQAAGGACTFLVSPGVVRFPSTGGNGSFDLTATTGCNWRVGYSSSANFLGIRVDNIERNGNLARLSFSATANQYYASTNEYIEIVDATGANPPGRFWVEVEGRAEFAGTRR